VGLDRQAAQEAFAEYLDEARFTVEQIRFIGAPTRAVAGVIVSRKCLTTSHSALM